MATQTDARGKVVTTVTDPDKGIVTKVTDPKGQEVNSQYDTLRRLTKTSTMLTSTQEVKSENTYDSMKGYLTSTTHNTDGNAANNVTYCFTYDSLGHQTSVSVGSNVLSTTYYDAIKRTLDHVAFGNGGGVQYLYDSFSRVTGIRYDNATTNRFSYGYDAQGRVAYVVDHLRGVKVYTDYDLAGRPCQKTHMLGTAHSYTGKLTYNQYELPDTFTEYVGATRAKHTTNFAYDEENRPTSVTYDAGSVTYTYDKIGRLTQRSVATAGAPVTTSYGYVDGGQGTNSTTGLIQTITQNGVTLTYVYDDNGNITSVSDGTKTTSYEYDAIGQLIRVNDQTDTTAGTTGTTWVFTYDLGGNILTKAAYSYTTGTVGMATESHTYTYGNAGWKDQLTALDGTPITYDSIGNPTNDGTWTYTWQHGKQLQQMQKTENGVTTTIQFEYNEDGLRTKKIVTVGNDTVATEYVLHGKSIVHMTSGSDNLHFLYDAQGKPAEVIFSGVAYRYLYNLQGDVVALVDGSGTKVVEYGYDAWGKPTSRIGSLASSLGTMQPFRYRGYVWDDETGLYYLISRYFGPGFCKFIGADVLIKGNLYCYCHNNPVDLMDADGKNPLWILDPTLLLRESILKYEISVAASTFLTRMNYPVTKMLFNCALAGTFRCIRNTSRSSNLLIDALVESEETQQFIESQIRINDGRTSIALIKEDFAYEDGDLYYALHKVTFSGHIEVSDSGNWTAELRLRDTFNFDDFWLDYSGFEEFKSSFYFGGAANDFGRVLQLSGLLKEIDIDVNFVVYGQYTGD